MVAMMDPPKARRSMVVSSRVMIASPGPVDGGRGVTPRFVLGRARSGPDLVEAIPVVESAVLHHVLHAVGIPDTLQRVLVEHDQVGQLAGFDRAQIAAQSDRLGAEQ